MKKRQNYIWFAPENALESQRAVKRDPYTFCVTRTDPYKVFLHAQERYWSHFQSTDVTLKHSGAPRALVCTPATRREKRRAAGLRQQLTEIRDLLTVDPGSGQQKKTI